jgi:hypothetical protein
MLRLKRQTQAQVARAGRANAVGAYALGALAGGAGAVGALAIGRLAIGRGSVKAPRIHELRVDRLTSAGSRSSAAARDPAHQGHRRAPPLVSP